MESVWSSIFGVSQVSTSLSAFWLGFFPTVWVPNPISIHIIWYLFSEISTMISPFSPVTSQCFNCFNPHFNCLVVHQTKRQTISPSSTIWVWVNTYYIIHINTIFSGMNIHESQLFLCSPGVQGFDTLPYQSISTHGFSENPPGPHSDPASGRRGFEVPGSSTMVPVKRSSPPHARWCQGR